MRSLRHLFRKLPINGEIRDALRSFNLASIRGDGAVSVRELAEKLGLNVYLVELPAGLAGRLVPDAFADAGYSVEINKRHGVRSRRYTLLHEIGHYLLHAKRNDPLAETMNLSRQETAFYFDLDAEREANDFADVLLFGDGALAQVNSLYAGDTKMISHFFGVTENIVEVALRKYRLT